MPTSLQRALASSRRGTNNSKEEEERGGATNNNTNIDTSNIITSTRASWVEVDDENANQSGTTGAIVAESASSGNPVVVSKVICFGTGTLSDQGGVEIVQHRRTSLQQALVDSSAASQQPPTSSEKQQQEQQQQIFRPTTTTTTTTTNNNNNNNSSSSGSASPTSWIVVADDNQGVESITSSGDSSNKSNHSTSSKTTLEEEQGDTDDDNNNLKMVRIRGEEEKEETPPPPPKKEEEEKKEEEKKEGEEEKKEDGKDDKKEEGGDDKKKEEEEDEDEKPAKFVFEGRNPRLIKANVTMISGCMDRQYSADVGGDTTNKFKLTDPAGLYSGALTTTILDTLGEEIKKDKEDKLTCLKFLETIRAKLKDKAEAEQVPQFSSNTKEIDMENEPFEFITPSDVKGTKRAVVIGINYVGSSSELSGCWNDAINMKNFLVDSNGFQEENIIMLMDDGKALKPSKWNILSELNKMVEASEPGDFCFMHYSGHGSWELDKDGDEEDGIDECLCAVSGGLILDDELFENVVTQLKKDVTMFALIDACHSGTVLDLPYRFAFKEDEAVEDVREEILNQILGDDEKEDSDEDDDDDDEKDSDLDDQMMAMTSMLLMMQVSRKMGKKKSKKLKDKMNKMMEFFG